MRIRAKTSTFIGVSRGKTMIDSEGSKTLHLRFDLKTLLDHWPSDLYQTHPPLTLHFLYLNEHWPPLHKEHQGYIFSLSYNLIL